MSKTLEWEDVIEDFVGGAVGDEENVFRNVRVLGERSKNGRRYTVEAMRQAVAAGRYDCPVFVGHADTFDRPRSISELFGRLQNAHVQDGTIRADLRANPHHPRFAEFARAVKNDPRSFGLSHACRASGRKRDGIFVIEEIAAVRSVDIVPNPATNRGLWESTGRPRHRLSRAAQRRWNARADLIEAEEERRQVRRDVDLCGGLAEYANADRPTIPRPGSLSREAFRKLIRA